MPKSQDTIAAEIRKVAQDSSRVYLSKHVQDRMEERGITQIQVLRCLCSGDFLEGPILDSEKQLGWKSTQRALSAGVWVEVVSKLIERADGHIIVITAYNRAP